MKWLQIVVIAMILGLGCLGILAQAPAEIGIVRSGFLGNGPWATWGGPWLALMERNGSFELREETVTSTRQTIPAACDGTIGFVYNVDARPAAPEALLFRGFPAMKAGPVVTAFHGNKFLFPGEDLDVSLGGDSQWWLIAFGTARPNQQGNPRFIDYQVRLTGPASGRTATVFSLALVDEDRPPKILWVGDLDADKIPDIIVEDITDHYNVNRHTLFLSSSARAGQLVTEAASISTSGC